VKPVKTYSTQLEADLARIKLDGAGVRAVVVGVGVDMRGGMGGVQLLVPDDQIDAALRILADD
jgi:hypothetical protein